MSSNSNEHLANYKRRFVAHHDERLEKFGADVRAVWNSAQSQEQRFRILTEVGDCRNASVLDIGCGMGDLYGYLQKQKLGSAYTGVDLSAKMVATARNKYPKGTFRVADILSDAMDEQFDYVFASGIFWFPFPTEHEWDEFVVNMLRKMLALSRHGVAVNFLSAMSEKPDAESVYAEPSRVLRLVQPAVTKWVTLRHDYRLNDFTLYLYREQHAAA